MRSSTGSVLIGTKAIASHELQIELIYHTIKSSQFEAASEIIVSEGRQLVSQGYMELLGLIEQVETTELARCGGSMAQIQGDILALLGRLTKRGGAECDPRAGIFFG